MLAGGANVNAPNDNGHTPIIYAIVAGQYHLLPLLLNAGANPALRDHTGLSAIDWAERKGRPDLAQSLASAATNTPPIHPEAEHIRPLRTADETERPSISDDEKSRRFITGLRQRLEEKANRISPKDEPQSQASETDPTKREATDEPRGISRETASREELTVEKEEESIEPKREPVPLTSEGASPKSAAAFDVSTSPKSSSPTAKTGFKSHTSSHRKRCPRCGATYDSERLGYCVFHEVALIGVDEPIPMPPAEARSSILLWVLVLFAVTLGGLGGLFVTGALFRTEPISTPAPTTFSPITQKGIPTLEKPLAGKEVTLLEAEVPANTVKEPTTVTVHVMIERDGHVSSASVQGGDQVLRDAVTEAARKSTFSVKKLGGRGIQGTISYTFK